MHAYIHLVAQPMKLDRPFVSLPKQKERQLRALLTNDNNIQDGLYLVFLFLVPSLIFLVSS
jgi:hypothetical protein